MDETTGTGPTTTPSTRKKTGRGPLWVALGLVLAFIAGFGWQWYEASQVRAELSSTQEQLLVERLRVRLGQAALAAQAGDYESARQQMSAFFSRTSEVTGLLPDSVAEVTTGFLAMRDEVITGLSRSNPEYAGVLYGMLERFRTVTEPTETMPTEGAPAAPTPMEEAGDGTDGATDATDATEAASPDGSGG